MRVTSSVTQPAERVPGTLPLLMCESSPQLPSTRRESSRDTHDVRVISSGTFNRREGSQDIDFQSARVFSSGTFTPQRGRMPSTGAVCGSSPWSLQPAEKVPRTSTRAVCESFPQELLEHREGSHDMHSRSVRIIISGTFNQQRGFPGHALARCASA